MNITSARYTAEGHVVAFIDNLSVTIPEDDSYYKNLLAKWETNGNVIEPYIAEISTIYHDKSPREFRDILIDEGVLTDAVPDEVTVKIQEIPFDVERAKALNAWHNMTTVQRSDPYVDMIGAMFGYTPEDIDSLWMGAE